MHAVLRTCEDSELECEGVGSGTEAGACIVRTATAPPRACAPNTRKVCLVVDVSVGMEDEVADDGSSRAIDSLSVEPNATSSVPPIDASGAIELTPSLGVRVLIALLVPSMPVCQGYPEGRSQ